MTVDELEAIGLRRMDDHEIRTFLANQDVGVLGLPTAGAPYLLPLSFSVDGDRLLFAYLLGETSRKETLSERADSARFLVFDVEGSFTWLSVLLSGTVSTIPDDEREDAAALMDNAWRPDFLDDADLSRSIALYQFSIDERSGIKHIGLPPELERERLAGDEP